MDIFTILCSITGLMIIVIWTWFLAKRYAQPSEGISPEMARQIYTEWLAAEQQQEMMAKKLAAMVREMAERKKKKTKPHAVTRNASKRIKKATGSYQQPAYEAVPLNAEEQLQLDKALLAKSPEMSWLEDYEDDTMWTLKEDIFVWTSEEARNTQDVPTQEDQILSATTHRPETTMSSLQRIAMKPSKRK